MPINDYKYDNNQQYNNGYDQQLKNGYDNIPKIQEILPEGVLNHLPESWIDSIEDALAGAPQAAPNTYEQIPVQNTNAYIKPVFAIIAMVSLSAGCIVLKLGNPGAFVFSVGAMCTLIGIGIMIDRRNILKKHMRSFVFLIFGIEVLLAVSDLCFLFFII